MARDKEVGVIGMVAARNLIPGNAKEFLKLRSRAARGDLASSPDPHKSGRRRGNTVSTLLQSRPRAQLSAAREDAEGYLELPAAGYTFAISHPALASVLTGTTDPVHLEQNVEAALAPALTSGEIAQLRKLLQEAEGS